MSNKNHPDHRSNGFFFGTLIPGLARRFSFTLTVALCSSPAIWLAFFYTFLLVSGVDDHFTKEISHGGILILGVSLIISSLFHFLHYGLLTRSGLPGFFGVPRIINQTLVSGLSWKPVERIGDEGFANFARAFQRLPRDSFFVSLFFSSLTGVVLTGYVFVTTKVISTTLIMGLGALLAISISTYWSFLITGFLGSPVRSKIREEIKKRKLSVTLNSSHSLKFSFLIFIVLSTLLLITTAVYVQKNLGSLVLPIIFGCLSVLIISLISLIHYLSMKRFLMDLSQATSHLVKGKPGMLFPSIDITDLQQPTENFNTVAMEYTALRDSFDEQIEERTRQMLHKKDQAEANNLAKSNLMADMAEDILIPMNGILSITENLLKTETTVEQNEHLRIIERSTFTLLANLHNVLDLSKIESNTLELVEVSFNLGPLIEDIADNMAIKAMQKRLNLNTTIAPNIPESLMGDPLRLKQILLNVVNNAIRFSNQGTVQVTCSLEEKKANRCIIAFKINDTGQGVRQRDKEKLFTSTAGGSGLGLMISKKLVEMMGGTIGVDSEPDRGSTIWFLVPFALKETVSVIQDQPEGEFRSHSIRTSNNEETNLQWVTRENEGQRDGIMAILLVEDNKINQRIAKLNLESLGFNIEVACDGPEAVARYQHRRFDLIFIDVQMPSTDGLETTHQIREFEKRTPGKLLVHIVGMTGNASKSEREACLEAGMNDYISKPFRAEELRKVVGRWLTKGSGKMHF